MFKRKKHVTNWDVLDEIVKHGRHIKFSAFNTFMLEIQQHSFRLRQKEVREKYLKFKQAYESYQAIPNDRTSPKLKILLEKILELADLEIKQQARQLDAYVKSMEDIQWVLTDLAGHENSRRKLSDEEVQRYIDKADTILVSFSSSDEKETVFLPLDGYTANIIDVLSKWNVCRTLINRISSVRAYEYALRFTERNGALSYVLDAYKDGRPTNAYIHCMSAAEELITLLHGLGYGTKGALYIRRVLHYPDDREEFICGFSKDNYQARIELCEIPKRKSGSQGSYLKAYTGSKNYPRNTDGELAIASAALSILYKLEGLSKIKEKFFIRRSSAVHTHLKPN